MKRILFIILSVLAVVGAGYLTLHSANKYLSCANFMIGSLFGIFLMNLILISKNRKINSYARELEKESISSTENLSRVKVLESKIEVLEKALENALKNK